MPQHVQHFIVGVLVTVLWPLLPLGIEVKFGKIGISVGSLYVASLMYVSAVSLAYESILVFYIGILSAIWLAVDFGFILSADRDATPAAMGVPAVMIFAFGLMQIVKCYDLHVIQRQNFIYFPRLS